MRAKPGSDPKKIPVDRTAIDVYETRTRNRCAPQVVWMPSDLRFVQDRMRFETRLTKIDLHGHRRTNLEPNKRRGTNSVAKTGELMLDNYPNCGKTLDVED